MSGRGAQGVQASGRSGAGGRAGVQGRAERRRADGSSRGRRRRGRAAWRERVEPAAWARGARGARSVSARGAWPRRACARRLGVLAGQLGWFWCIVHLAQF